MVKASPYPPVFPVEGGNHRIEPVGDVTHGRNCHERGGTIFRTGITS